MVLVAMFDVIFKRNSDLTPILSQDSAFIGKLYGSKILPDFDETFRLYTNLACLNQQRLLGRHKSNLERDIQLRIQLRFPGLISILL